MTNEEFSNEFDTLISSYIQSKPFGVVQTAYDFDEYEKSVFLTKALELVVLNLYNGKLVGDSFELTEELRRYLGSLTKKHPFTETETLSFKVPDDVLFITHEEVKFKADPDNCIAGDSIIEVVPVTHDDLNRIKDNPFKSQNRRRVLRLDIDNKLELVTDYPILEYTIWYLSRPKPIILLDLEDGLKINEESKETECELNPALHRIILDLAVSLALASRSKAGLL